MIPQWQKLLADRGVLDVARLAEWGPDGHGWKYPVTKLDRVIHRWKAFNSNANPKYSWPDGKPEGVKYYMLDGADEAIFDTGEVYIASGEPDNLTYVSAGISNVLNWYGEGNVPSTLVEDLSGMGVATVRYNPDLDMTGEGSALKVCKMLAGTGIDVKIGRLPDELGDKGDINKLWITCKFDVGTFRYCLDNLPQIEIQDLKTLPDVEPDDREDFPATFYEEIERALNVRSYEDDGWSKAVRCPLRNHEHDNDRPAGAWHKVKHIFYCQKCAADHATGYVLAKDMARVLNIALPRKQQALRTQSKQLPDKDVWSWSDASDRVVDELLGEVDGSVREPLPMPFRSIAAFDGLAKLILPRKIIAVVGDSGDGKTSLTETLVDFWRKTGFSGAWYSPEWGKDETIYRAIQRAGGPSYMQVVDHRAWCAAARRGTPENKRPGASLPEALSDRGIALVEEIRCWPGKLWLIEKMSINLDEFMVLLTQTVDAHPEIAFVVVDYAQLLGTGSEGIDRALTRFKAFCVDRDLVGLVASQVPKEMGRKQSSGNDKLSQHALQNARSDYFNLVLTINRELNDHGERDPTATIRIAKNSLGRTGETKLYLNDERLMWFDTTKKEVNS